MSSYLRRYTEFCAIHICLKITITQGQMASYIENINKICTYIYKYRDILYLCTISNTIIFEDNETEQ